jgi:dUTPase
MGAKKVIYTLQSALTIYVNYRKEVKICVKYGYNYCKISHKSHITQGFFQDFGNITHTHGIGNFSNILFKNWEKMHD